VTVAPRFEAEYRVRFDEADARGHLRPSGFLRYAQDVAWQHSESAGFGRGWYAEQAMHWLVRDVELCILVPAEYGDRLSVSTEVTGWRHVWARRHAEVRRQPSPTATDGAGPDLIAVIETDWVLLGIDGRPVRVPTEIAAFLAPGKAFWRRRLDLDATPGSVERSRTHVRAADVDPMGHLNNAAYLDLVDEAVAAALPPSASDAVWGRYRVGYLQPALAGSDIEVACWPAEGGTVACRISDAGGRELTRAVVGPLGD
jgi:acyl-CoA thioesterase FadM